MLYAGRGRRRSCGCHKTNNAVSVPDRDPVRCRRTLAEERDDDDDDGHRLMEERALLSSKSATFNWKWKTSHFARLSVAPSLRAAWVKRERKPFKLCVCVKQSSIVDLGKCQDIKKLQGGRLVAHYDATWLC